MLGHAGAPSFTTDWDAVRPPHPTCAWSRRAATTRLARRAEARASPAATCAPRVVAVDASAYLSRPGPRIVDGAELLAAILHPDAVPAFPRAGRLGAWSIGTPGTASATVPVSDVHVPFGDLARVR